MNDDEQDSLRQQLHAARHDNVRLQVALANQAIILERLARLHRLRSADLIRALDELCITVANNGGRVSWH